MFCFNRKFSFKCTVVWAFWALGAMELATGSLWLLGHDHLEGWLG